MDEQAYLDFLSAPGQELCAALSPIVDEDAIVPHDAYDAFLRAFKQKPDPQIIGSLTEL